MVSEEVDCGYLLCVAFDYEHLLRGEGNKRLSDPARAAQQSNP
jgi:hypothetical protein